MRERRLNNELKTMDSEKIRYDLISIPDINNSEIMDYKVNLYSNYGKIILSYPRDYPFKPPHIDIFASIFYYDNDNFNKYYFLCNNIDDRLPYDLKMNILDKLINSLPKKKILFKKFIDNFLKYRYLNFNTHEVLFQYDDLIYNNWSPVLKLINIIEKIHKLNDSFKIPEKRYIVIN